ncbi:methylmalonic aciduria and homocystinuria type C protein homolog [Asterias rubens]|uniref:methylmalonic aciduria and homocystinuria type C protein homolog n=1 Tax=Asterias rubens TaxID=7604 RepID=UPI001455B00F|nr:methylmalonic aciduria and homocystinuria type C protein homolog [Asterias rubens]
MNEEFVSNMKHVEECKTDCQPPKYVDVMTVQKLQKSLENVLDPLGFEVHPFKIGWYNEKVQTPFHLSYHEDTVAFCVISSPSMFEKAFKPYVQSLKVLGSRDPLDDCVGKQYQRLKESLPEHRIVTIQDYELHPNRRPKILVQTVGHVSGGAYYYQRSDMKQDPWGQKKIFGVSIHPRYGGWFAFRGVLIFPDIRSSDLPKQEPPNVIPTDKGLRDLLEKFNDHWQDNSYRDCIKVEDRYSVEQVEYFGTLPAERGKLLGLSSEKTTDEKNDRFH